MNNLLNGKIKISPNVLRNAMMIKNVLVLLEELLMIIKEKHAILNIILKSVILLGKVMKNKD